MYAPAYAGAAVAEAKAKAKASMAKYLASLVKREEEGWTVLAAEVPQAPDERFFSSADELEQAPLIPAKRKAEDEPMEDAAPGVAQVPKALTRPPGAFLEPAGGGCAHGGAPGEGRGGAPDVRHQVAETP